MFCLSWLGFFSFVLQSLAREEIYGMVYRYLSQRPAPLPLVYRSSIPLMMVKKTRRGLVKHVRKNLLELPDSHDHIQHGKEFTIPSSSSCLPPSRLPKKDGVEGEDTSRSLFRLLLKLGLPDIATAQLDVEHALQGAQHLLVRGGVAARHALYDGHRGVAARGQVLLRQLGLHLLALLGYDVAHLLAHRLGLDDVVGPVHLGQVLALHRRFRRLERWKRDLR